MQSIYMVKCLVNVGQERRESPVSHSTTLPSSLCPLSGFKFSVSALNNAWHIMAFSQCLMDKQKRMRNEKRSME